ncbi:MAG: phosphatase PAP2 family protein, partial [Muribaculaceae bacterium]|nr:phosphatase PAP2 family protein [Muribaculaceae bacterium]
MKFQISILILIFSLLHISAQEFTPSRSQKAVAKSTDALVIALPAAALTGVLIQKDWKGLIQGVETAGVTAAATLILKYSIKETRPDYSNRHSFPS